MASTAVPKVGQWINHYELLEELGRRDLAIDFRVRRAGLDVDLALRLLLPPSGEEMRSVRPYERFESVAEVLQGLEHPSSLIVREFRRDDLGRPYLVTELVEGKSLHAAVQEGPLSIRRTLRVTSHVLGFLAEAHRNGLVHSGLNPKGVIIVEGRDGRDRLKVLDLGVAKITQSARRLSAQDGSRPPRFGSPWYMAPEQAGGVIALDGRVDLYALGLIVAECVSGHRVLETGDPLKALVLQAKNQPIAYRMSVRQSPLFPVIYRATQKDRDRRFPDARAMYEAVLQVGKLKTGELVAATSEQKSVAPPSAKTDDEVPPELPDSAILAPSRILAEPTMPEAPVADSHSAPSRPIPPVRLRPEPLETEPPTRPRTSASRPVITRREPAARRKPLTKPPSVWPPPWLLPVMASAAGVALVTSLIVARQDGPDNSEQSAEEPSTRRAETDQSEAEAPQVLEPPPPESSQPVHSLGIHRPLGEIRVRSPIPGATIVLDGEQVGETITDTYWPVLVETGAHQLGFVEAGGRTHLMDVTVEEGRHVTVFAPLLPNELAAPDGAPVRRVEAQRVFYVAVRPVSVGDFTRCLADVDCAAAAEDAFSQASDAEGCWLGIDQAFYTPMNCISQRGAIGYCRHYGMRLPTDVEWALAETSLDLGAEVWQWTSTLAPTSGDAVVVRGGRRSGPDEVDARRSRGVMLPESRDDFIGFRCVMGADEALEHLSAERRD